MPHRHQGLFGSLPGREGGNQRDGPSTERLNHP
jgi:hypothetical protein